MAYRGGGSRQGGARKRSILNSTYTAGENRARTIRFKEDEVHEFLVENPHVEELFFGGPDKNGEEDVKECAEEETVHASEGFRQIDVTTNLPCARLAKLEPVSAACNFDTHVQKDSRPIMRICIEKALRQIETQPMKLIPQELM